jgi:5-methyltetrahydropteroyltriglutamate--homocysteine methyltransferase
MGIPFRADHLGSLLRPPELLAARVAHKEGRLNEEGLRAAEDAAVLTALDLQRQVGLGIFTDGEYRRWNFMAIISDNVAGFVRLGPRQSMYQWQGEGAADSAVPFPVVGGRLQPTRRLSARELPFLRAHAPGPIKLTIPGASQFGHNRWVPGVTDQFYATPADLQADVTAIVRDEIRALVDDGVAYVQLDAPSYTHYADPRLVAGMRERGVDPDRALDEAIAADNACLDAATGDGVVSAIHFCRGNNRSSWMAQGGYDPIAEKLLQGLRADRFLLEYDSERAGTFEPLGFVPKGRTVVLGLVTTKTGQLESQDALLRRIEEASRYVPVEDLALSPQCGFASMAEGNLLSWDDQRRKLDLVVDTARRVWG